MLLGVRACKRSFVTSGAYRGRAYLQPLSLSSMIDSRSYSHASNDKHGGRFVRIVEVSPRDGLQNLPPPIIPTQTKLELISRLTKTGLRNIEVGSFVRADRVPQMGDSSTVLTSLQPYSQVPTVKLAKERKEAVPLSGVPGHTDIEVPEDERGMHYPVLVPNIKGLEGLLQLEGKRKGEGGERLTDEIAVFVSATEAFSKANNNASIDKVMEGVEKVMSKALEHGYRVRGYVSCVMTDPFSGKTDPKDVVSISKRLLSLGAYEISLGDTTGEGTPSQWVTLWKALEGAGIEMDKIAAHCHDTFASSLSSLTALLPLGLKSIDSSLAGLGGCPYSPGATGNVPTEDVVYMLHSLGYETGVDLEELVEVGEWLCGELGVKNESRVGRAISARKRKREKKEKEEKDGQKARL